MTITISDFERVDMRVGVVVDVQDFQRARTPAYKLLIDFGPEIGVRPSSAQVTNYAREELRGRQVIAVVNFPPKNIAGFRSEVLVLGAPGADGRIALLAPDRPAALGGRVS